MAFFRKCVARLVLMIGIVSSLVLVYFWFVWIPYLWSVHLDFGGREYALRFLLIFGTLLLPLACFFTTAIIYCEMVDRPLPAR